jgi:hypothetical protein
MLRAIIALMGQKKKEIYDFLSSLTYPLEVYDKLITTVNLTTIALSEIYKKYILIADILNITNSILSINLKDILKTYLNGAVEIINVVNPITIAINLRILLNNYNILVEYLNQNLNITNINLRILLITYLNYQPEKINTSTSITGITLL